MGPLAIVGAGRLGAALAGALLWEGGALLERGLRVFDPQPERALALVDDLRAASLTLRPSACSSQGSSDPAVLSGVKLALICAGFPPLPGASEPTCRDLNVRMGSWLGALLREHAPGARVLVATQPSLAVAQALAVSFAPGGDRRGDILALGPLFDEARALRLIRDARGSDALPQLHWRLDATGLPRVDPAASLLDGRPLPEAFSAPELELIIERARGLEERRALRGGSAALEASALMVRCLREIDGGGPPRSFGLEAADRWTVAPLAPDGRGWLAASGEHGG